MDLAAAVAAAADTLTFDTETLRFLGCDEADAIARVLAAGGHTDAAVAVLRGHARSDEDGDAHDGLDADGFTAYAAALLRG